MTLHIIFSVLIGYAQILNQINSHSPIFQMNYTPKCINAENSTQYHNLICSISLHPCSTLSNGPSWQNYKHSTCIDTYTLKKKKIPIPNTKWSPQRIIIFKTLSMILWSYWRAPQQKPCTLYYNHKFGWERWHAWL